MIYITERFASSMFQGLGKDNAIVRGDNKNVLSILELEQSDISMCIQNQGIQKFLEDKGIQVINNQRRIQLSQGDTLLVIKPSSCVIDFKTGGQLPQDITCVLEEWFID